MLESGSLKQTGKAMVILAELCPFDNTVLIVRKEKKKVAERLVNRTPFEYRIEDE